MTVGTGQEKYCDDNYCWIVKEDVMKVKIDYDLCMGDGHCSEVCPEVFAYDDEKTFSSFVFLHNRFS